MTPARAVIVFPGALSSLQDLGRSGLRRAGVPRAGALQPAWLRLANLLAGNDEGCAAIEFFGGGLQLKADDAPLRVALAGSFAAEIVSADGGRQALASWRSVTLSPGEQLRCGSHRSRQRYHKAADNPRHLRYCGVTGSHSGFRRCGTRFS